ncbi:MAG: hypothetical protein HRU38_24475 [Saccharospirillaceae bacterium]|nr:hypothetical protein [Saccharospirillaceae bacterium]
MQSVQCEIVENKCLIKKIIIKKIDDMIFHFEMFEGIRYFDVTQQYKELREGSSASNEQIYPLFCSYFKFGEMQQEKRAFTVTLIKKKS